MYLAKYLSEFSLDATGWSLRAQIAELSDKNWHDAAEYYIQSHSLSESDPRTLIQSKLIS